MMQLMSTFHASVAERWTPGVLRRFGLGSGVLPSSANRLEPTDHRLGRHLVRDGGVGIPDSDATLLPT
jgi:hypothetical protein